MAELTKLGEFGQSLWIDNLTREWIESGALERWVSERGLRGVTSNPKIFHAAISQSDAYDGQIAEVLSRGASATALYEALTTTDIRNACDILRPVYDETAGEDGFVSLEVSPHFARDTEASIEEGQRLFRQVDRPNLMIKIPGTAEGLPVIEELLFEGINVNVTLLFAVQRYQEVVEAYMRALARRREAKRPLGDVTSVASFFLSRIDVLVDQLLRHRITETGNAQAPDPQALLGRAAIANARLAYQKFKTSLESDRWKALARDGARAQRLLWASTSTKDPAYSDVMYVEPLIGAHTVNTMPLKTIEAFEEHGVVANTVEQGEDDAHRVMAGLEQLGIDMSQVTAQLENEGIQKFIDPYDALIGSLERRRLDAEDQRLAGPLAEVARRLRRLVIAMTTEAGSGHPTSCMSAADIIAALFFHEMRWDPAAPKARNVDQFVLSKGHAAPILWAALSSAGAIDEDPMTLRRIDSTLEGHPTPNNPWVRVATGSLGQGLSAANGIALANRLDGIDARVFCLLGDGECSEGSVWEAAQFASLNKLQRLVAIVDVNALGQSAPTPYRHHTEIFADRFAAFGWNTVEIDGHDIPSVLRALRESAHDRPTAIIARTIKGKGVSFLEGAEGWHGKPLDEEQASRAMRELGDLGEMPAVTARRVGSYAKPQRPPVAALVPDYEIGAKVATRDGYGNALHKLGGLAADIVALDGDVKNSTRAKGFAADYPNRFFECFIAEQNMVGVGLGLAACDKVPYVATFACFLSRAADFIRMAGHSRPHHLVFCGSHAGVSIGEDGPSQMGLEDIAMFRALLGSTVLYPSDAVSAERLTAEAARTDGIVYLRTTRPKTPVIYRPEETFPVGGSKVLRTSDEDSFTVIGAGITVHEALAAYDSLKEKGIRIRVIDAYSVKPLDSETVLRSARETRGLLVVEDHLAEGGLGDAVAANINGAAPVHRLAVKTPPRSGKCQELLDRHGISRTAIEATILSLAA